LFCSEEPEREREKKRENEGSARRAESADGTKED